MKFQTHIICHSVCNFISKLLFICFIQHKIKFRFEINFQHQEENCYSVNSIKDKTCFKLGNMMGRIKQ